MARIRSIKPEFWQDERLATLPRDVRMLFLGLLSIADDDGRLRGSPLFIRAQVFPYDLDVDVDAGLASLATIGRVVRYSAGGERYIWVCNFRKHQRIDKPTKSNLPPPPELQEYSASTPGSVLDDSREERKGEEGSGKEGIGGEVPPPPTNGRTVAAPTTPPEAWLFQDFEAFAQDRRVAGGLIPERPQNPRKGSSWWSGCLLTPGVTPAAMIEGFYAFGRDKHWEARGFPLNAFMSQWDKYTRPEVADGAAA